MEKATKIKLSDGTIVDISGREYTLESFGITVTPGEINYLSGLDENIITKLEKQLNDSKSYTDTKIKELDNATYQKIVDCPHEFQITAKTGCEYNLAIPDETTLKLLTIKGQTGRYSENELNIPDKIETVNNSYTYSCEKGVVTISASEVKQFTGVEFATIYLNNGQDYTLYCPNVPQNFLLRLQYSIDETPQYDVQLYNNIPLKAFTFRGNGNVTIRLQTDAASKPSFNKTNLYIQLLKGTYTESTMPSFKPYDSTLVNAKCNLISTNKNLLDVADFVKTRNSAGRPSYMVDNGYTFKSNYSIDPRTLEYKNSDYYLTLPKGDYTFRYNLNDTTTTSDAACIIIFDETEKRYLEVLFKNATNYYKNFTLEKETKIGILTKTYDLKISLALNYGTGSNIEFETQEKDTYILNEELGEFDYIDNVAHKKVNQQKLITLDGSSDEYYSVSSAGNSNGIANFSFYFNGNNLPTHNKDDGASDTVTNWKYSSEVQANTSEEGIYVNKQNIYIRLKTTTATTVEALRTWLQSNPIMIAYKTAEPISTTDLNLPAGYKAWNGGLQWQQSQGKYLPYILTKEYAISQRAQIDLNADMNVNQQALIDKNKNDIEQLKNNIGTSISYEEIIE